MTYFRTILHLSWLLLLGTPCNTFATAGLAEWEVQTPGTNVVCHSDPYIETHGTCLRPSDATFTKNPKVSVYVSHIEWWQYFKGRVIGKAQKGFFIFDESRKSVAFLETETGLQAELAKLGAGKAITRRLIPQDGWALSWAPVIQSQYDQLKKSEEYKKMSTAQKEQLAKQYDQVKMPDIRPEDK
jgi:hypothetical protein